ncbi:MAG: hypothetical protein AMS15_05640 [Planctomycetes bacterium DG_23]|nr:MAG: hypothetical protein AMS15_05640 [Planctomycetes bacterium DG_23]
MKVGILADSHDNLPMIRRALHIFRQEGAECVIHAGDFIAPFAVKELLKFPGPLYGIFGNNDGEKEGIRKIWPEVKIGPAVFEIGGKNILLVHSKDDASEEEIDKADVFIYAHSHKPEVIPDDTLVINPGECGGWLSGKSTVVVLDLESMDGKIVLL